MYTASILSLLALAATTLAAPAGQVAGYERAIVTQTVIDTVVETVFVTPGQAIPTAANNAPISEAANGSLELPAPTSAPAASPSVASVASVASSVATPEGGLFVATSKASTTAQSTPKASSIPSTTLQTKTSAASQPQTTTKPATGAVSAQNGLLTIQITNSMTVAVTTSYAGASLASGASGAGSMTKGATAAIAVASGWSGNIAVSTEQNSGSDGLIEGSFVSQGQANAVADMDVSFVNGYTVPMTCSCVSTGLVLTGCNTDLFAKSTCTTPGAKQGVVCPNPLRSLSDTDFDVTPNPFFAACAGAAYTFPADNAANAGNGKCPSNIISCCIGSSCPKNADQS